MKKELRQIKEIELKLWELKIWQEDEKMTKKIWQELINIVEEYKKKTHTNKKSRLGGGKPRRF